MYHFDKTTWSINTEEKGIKIPTAVVLLLAPILGAAFLMFMPFIGIYLSVKALIDKLAVAIVSSAPAQGPASNIVVESDKAATNTDVPR